MRLSTILVSAIALLSSASAAKLEKRCSLKREPMTIEDGLVCYIVHVLLYSSFISLTKIAVSLY